MKHKMHDNRILKIIVAMFLPFMAHASLDFTCYLNNSLRGRIPGLTLDFCVPPHIRKITPYGFIQLEAHGDSRQVIGTFEALSALYPQPVELDPFCKDINDHPQVHLTPRRSVFGVYIEGPRTECVSSVAVIEAGFKAIAADKVGKLVGDVLTIMSMNLRHAFMYISFDSAALLIGQYWHPLAMPECWAETVDPDGANPVEFGGRFPQIRFIKSFGKTDLAFTMASERNDQSFGPVRANTQYIRRGIIPNLNFEIIARSDKILFGASLDYKRLFPALNFQEVFGNFEPAVKQHSYLNSFIVAGYLKIEVNKDVTFRFKGGYIQNGADQSALSGYAIRAVDRETDQVTYINTACWNIWGDCGCFVDKKQEHQLGVFGGFTKNLGAREPVFLANGVVPIIYTLPQQNALVDWVLKVIPRYVFTREPFVVALELAVTRASWGTPNQCARVVNTTQATNVRGTLQFNYVF